MKRSTSISRTVEIGLRFIGMWPDSAYPNLYWSMYMTMVVVFQYHQYSYVVAHFDVSNLTSLTDCLGLALANTLAFFKLICLWWNRRIFYNILTAMKRDWNDRVISDSYSVLAVVAAQSRRYSYVLIGIHILAGFFLSIGAYTIRMMTKIDNSREFPIKMKFSFEVLESPLFECVLATQILCILSIASVVGMINALLATLVIHVGGQVDIMRQAIMEVHSTNDLTISLNVFRDLVRRHRKIIALSNDIESLFSTISLLQLLWNTLIICCTGFMIILALSSSKAAMAILMKSMFLYIAKTLEVFVFCYAGEFLSSKSKSISDVVYESLWYDMVPSDRRILLFIMVRSQKRLTITAGKVFDLTLEGFMSVRCSAVKCK
ncbi:hypothetical protein PUN28_001119 [Cardiocondyla obscurior]|uniref:Odorant receptor n=2 Tax=Cardiocondyla obscurior TaxID=286306 RepID=A0AAW2H345_9HYME